MFFWGMSSLMLSDDWERWWAIISCILPESGGYATPGMFTPTCLGGGLLICRFGEYGESPLIEGGGVINTAWSGIVWYGFSYGLSLELSIRNYLIFKSNSTRK